MNSKEKTVEIWGVPFDLCGRIYGARLGPGALRLKQVRRAIADQGFEVKPMGDVIELDFELPANYEEKMKSAVDCYRQLADSVEGSIGRGALPVVLGGDHSLSIGSISGALRGEGADDVAVLWIDAHMDLNTPGTSGSGNFHGMPLASLMRMANDGAPRDPGAEKVWDQIHDEVVPVPGLRSDRVGWIGLRDVDAGEIQHYEALGIETAWTMQDIDHLGIPAVLEQVDGWLRRSGARKVWVSFDVDSLDPVLAPGTGTAVRGGLTYREGHLLAELLYQMVFSDETPYELLGVDLVEVNPMEDIGSNTAIAAVEWLGSLFGKRTMGPRSTGR